MPPGAARAQYSPRELARYQGNPLIPQGLVTADEGMRADPNPEKMATLKPCLPQTALQRLLTLADQRRRRRAADRQPRLRPAARPEAACARQHRSGGSRPCHPVHCCARCHPQGVEGIGADPADIDLFEVNEAFGGVPLMFQQNSAFGRPPQRQWRLGGHRPSALHWRAHAHRPAVQLERPMAADHLQGFGHGQHHHHRAPGMNGATMSEAAKCSSAARRHRPLIINRPRAEQLEPRSIRWPACTARATARRRCRTRGHHHRRRGRVCAGADITALRGHHHRRRGRVCAGADITAFDSRARTAAGRPCGGRWPLGGTGAL